MKATTPLFIAIALLSLGGQSYSATISVGVIGFDAGVNNWPTNEAPSAAIDGVGQKYLNFGEFNTGVIVTPGIGSSIATELTLWSANDAVPRDPSSYQVFGTNSIIGAGPFDSSLFTLISAGAVSLPATRNAGGAAPLDPTNSFNVGFANTEAYTSYMILFPTVADEAAANSMQIAEIQLSNAGGDIFSPGDAILGVQSDVTIPEPSTGLLALLALGGLGLRRRK